MINRLKSGDLKGTDPRDGTTRGKQVTTGNSQKLKEPPNENVMHMTSRGLTAVV